MFICWHGLFPANSRHLVARPDYGSTKLSNVYPHSPLRTEMNRELHRHVKHGGLLGGNGLNNHA